MRKRLHWSMLSAIAFLLGTCTPDSDKIETPQEGYRPLYMTRTDLHQVVAAAPHALRNAGKIYVRGNYVFVNELNQGIHVIDNRDPTNPQNISFIRIPGNVDIAVKGNTLYADNGPDLIAFDISNPATARLVKRIENVFPNQKYPPHTGVRFECVDDSKGVVIGWEKAILPNARCRR